MKFWKSKPQQTEPVPVYVPVTDTVEIPCFGCREKIKGFYAWQFHVQICEGCININKNYAAARAVDEAWERNR